jgi:hypothetical protein
MMSNSLGAPQRATRAHSTVSSVVTQQYWLHSRETRRFRRYGRDAASRRLARGGIRVRRWPTDRVAGGRAWAIDETRSVRVSPSHRPRNVSCKPGRELEAPANTRNFSPRERTTPGIPGPLPGLGRSLTLPIPSRISGALSIPTHAPPPSTLFDSPPCECNRFLCCGCSRNRSQRSWKDQGRPYRQGTHHLSKGLDRCRIELRNNRRS